MCLYLMILPRELLRQILEAQIACGQKLLYMPKGSSNTGKAYGAYALEGRGSVIAKIRSMDRANGVHKGGRDEGSATAYTYWNK